MEFGMDKRAVLSILKGVKTTNEGIVISNEEILK